MFARSASHFAKGSALYACRCCKRNTRATGRGDNEFVELCAECYDLAGLENLVNDGGELSAGDRSTIKSCKAAIAAKGGIDAFPGLVA